MQKFTPFLVALSLCAADPWQTKSFTEWSDKDVQKILTNSPWVHTVTIGGGPSIGEGATSGREDSATRPPQMSPATGPGVMAPNGQEGGRERRDSADPLNAPQSTVLTVLWQSALSVRQALVRRRFGAEGVGSVDAKKLLDERMNYLIAVSGLTPSLMRAPQAKSDMLQRTTLSAKGKDPLHATDILISPSGKVTEAIFVFPKTTSFALDDKDVEFSTQLGTFPVKSKFRLKDMVVNSTLQL